MEVTGRDRVHFFRRPILPNTTPLPYIRYAREISLDVADIKKRDRLKEEAGIKRVTINEPISPTKVRQTQLLTPFYCNQHICILPILVIRGLKFSLSERNTFSTKLMCHSKIFNSRLNSIIVDCQETERTKENLIIQTQRMDQKAVQLQKLLQCQAMDVECFIGDSQHRLIIGILRLKPSPLHQVLLL